MKTSSISLFESDVSTEEFSIKIDIQFSKVLSLWEPQDSIRCLHLFNDLYLSRRDKVPRRLCLGFFKVAKNNSSGLTKTLILFEAYVIEDKPRKVKEILKSYCL